MALGASTFSDFGGAATDLFSGVSSFLSAGIKSEGDLAEAQSYDEAAQLALQNEQFTKTATAVKTAQNEREIYQTISSQEAGVGGAGLAESGSALDLLRSSASQGALSQAIIGQQGLITEAGYQEQYQSYTDMAAALQKAASSEGILGDLGLAGGVVGGILKGVAGIATLL